MDGTPGEGQEPPMDRVARITLALGGFMMILLIAVPFTFESATSGYFASYVIYSLFLTSVGVIGRPANSGWDPIIKERFDVAGGTSQRDWVHGFQGKQATVKDGGRRPH